MDEDAAAALDAQAGNRPSSPYPEHSAEGAVLPLTKRTAGGYSDDGGPSRVYYCAKVSTREREHGCGALPMRTAAEMTSSAASVYQVWSDTAVVAEFESTVEAEALANKLRLTTPDADIRVTESRSARLESPRTGAGRGGGARNTHPTLKPIALAKWLASLIKPPTETATLLVPYSGAGSEMIGALTAGWPMVFGIEGEAEYVEIAHARIAAWAKGNP
jgi:hypothetical protein